MIKIHVLDQAEELRRGLDGDGHTAYPSGACSPVHPSGCLRCLEAENATLKAKLAEAQDEGIRVSLALHKLRVRFEEAQAENATLKEQLGQAEGFSARIRDRLVHAEANYGEELKRARAFEASAQELSARLDKTTQALEAIRKEQRS